jgi:predicted NBD/HSP70 family sugar kinase
VVVKDVSLKIERDKAVILDVVRRFGPVSRVGIHDLTKLRPGTISKLVRELLRDRKLLEVGPSDNPTGRKQVLLRLNQNSGSIVAVEFGDDAITAVVFDLEANVKGQLIEPANLAEGVDGLVNQLLRSAEAVMSQAGMDPRTLMGVGLADPGLIDSRGGISVASSTIEFWKAVPLRQIFESRFNVPVLLESNTRARAVAERMRGAGRMADDMLYLEYDAGIGISIFAGGRLLRGASECAGELGHTHVLDGGPPCKCGNFGCLEAVIGGNALAERARRAVLEGGRSKVLDLAGGKPEKITGWQVLAAAAQGDKMSSVIMTEVEEYLGQALASAVSLFNPGVVIIDRRLGQVDGFLEQIARIVRNLVLPRLSESLEFRYSELGVEAGALGAALLIMERYFEIPTIRLPKFMTEQEKPVTRRRLRDRGALTVSQRQRE